MGLRKLTGFVCLSKCVREVGYGCPRLEVVNAQHRLSGTAIFVLKMPVTEVKFGAISIKLASAPITIFIIITHVDHLGLHAQMAKYGINLFMLVNVQLDNISQKI